MGTQYTYGTTMILRRAASIEVLDSRTLHINGIFKTSTLKRGVCLRHSPLQPGEYGVVIVNDELVEGLAIGNQMLVLASLTVKGGRGGGIGGRRWRWT